MKALVSWFLLVSVAAPVGAQQRLAAPMGVRPEDTKSYVASANASLRAVALCSGLWSGGQTRQLIENRILPPAGDLETAIDDSRRIVQVTYSETMPPRIVVWRNVLGCVQLPAGATLDGVDTVPQVSPRLQAPDLDDRPWPTGDRDATVDLPPAEQTALRRVVEAAFDGKTYGGITWGVIVVHGGKIVAERYDPDFGVHVGHQTHSAAKSFASSLVGIATNKYRLDIQRAGALDEWRRPGDPRGRITVEHLLHMSSGLYGEGGGSPQSDIYYQGGTVEGRAVTNHLDSLPGTRFLYNPPDTMLLMRAVRQAVNDDRRYLLYPFEELFWKIGMTRTVTSSDWNGDFLMSGQTYSTARDFARFGLLYLADGVWNGERILPEGWAKYVATPGPVQPAGEGPRYGAQFWLYGGQAGLPADAFSPNGGQGQYAMIVPSRDVVIVRRGIDEASGFKIASFAADVLGALASRSPGER
jgi:CubicO group peptidase (beta-lactamase class C family)